MTNVEMKRKGSILSNETESPKKKMKQTDHNQEGIQSTWVPLGDVEELVLLIKAFSTEKKLLLKSLGFEALLHLSNKVIRKTMCRWVIDHFDPSTSTLEAYGDKVKITPMHVEYLLGLKDHGFDITHVEFEEEFSLDSAFIKFSQMDVKKMGTELRKIPHESPYFKSLFTLFLMTTLCSPTPDKRPRREWIHLVTNDNTIPHWNFASYLLEETVKAIHEFKAQSAPKTLGGCPLLLMAIFCEFSTKDQLDSIWKFDLPRIRDWNDINTKALHETITKLPRGYRSNKIMGLIEKDKLLISGKVPSTHAENVEKAFALILDKVNCLGRDLNKMFKLFLDFVDRQESGNAEPSEEEEEESSRNYKCSDEEHKKSKDDLKHKKVRLQNKRGQGKKDADAKLDESKMPLQDAGDTSGTRKGEDERKAENNRESRDEEHTTGGLVREESNSVHSEEGEKINGGKKDDDCYGSEEGRNSEEGSKDDQLGEKKERETGESDNENCRSNHVEKDAETEGDEGGKMDQDNKKKGSDHTKEQDHKKKRRNAREVKAPVEKKAPSRITRNIEEDVEGKDQKAEKKVMESELKRFKSEARAVVRYVFNNTLEKDEVLIKTKWIDASRWELSSLFPGAKIMEQVINLVGIRETLLRPTNFFIPTTLRHMDLKRKRGGSKYLPDSPIIGTSYLPDDPDQCKQILVPLWFPKPDHWYLCVVCMDECKIFMLDSHPDDKTKKKIKNAQSQIKKLASMMTANKDDERLERFESISKWDVEEVNTPKQVNGFDCGMHVIKIMEAQNRRKWTNKKYFEDLTTHRIKTLVALMEWDENKFKDTVKMKATGR